MELLETKKLEMEVETQLVLEARSGLEGSIEHLVVEDKLEKDTLSKKGEILAEELAGLLELVRLKEAEIAEKMPGSTRFKKELVSWSPDSMALNLILT